MKKHIIYKLVFFKSYLVILKLINIFLFSFISSLYLVCSGFIFWSKKNNKVSEIYKCIFFGSAFLSFISVLFNFFLPLDIKINSIIFIIILFIGFILIIKRKILHNVIFCSLLISIISTLILSFDTIYRPDANLYHLPFTQIINENKIIFGVSNIHFRFGHISILQYLNANFNNFLFKENGIIIPAAIIFSAFVLYFYNEIKHHAQINKIYTFYIFLLLAYILYGYNRYSEFGNDTIAHLYFFLISSYFLKDNYIKNLTTEDFIKLTILTLFCFMLKTSLVFAFIFPLYIFVINFKKKYIFNFYNIFIILISLSWIIKNLITSGCIIYPIEVTCFNSFEWMSNNSEDFISPRVQSLDNEAWTKGWPDYKGEVVSQQKYVENFYWLQTWLSGHGWLIFKKISIFVIINFILILSLKKISTYKNLTEYKFNNKIYLLLLFSLICVFIWFIRFPVFRYGSSYIVVLVITLSTIIAYKLEIFKIETSKFKKFLNLSLIIFLILFSLKHTLRIYKNYNNFLSDNAWPQFPKKENTKDISRPMMLNGELAYYLLKGKTDGCGYISSPCTPFLVKDNIYLKKVNGYKFYLIEK